MLASSSNCTKQILRIISWSSTYSKHKLSKLYGNRNEPCFKFVFLDLKAPFIQGVTVELEAIALKYLLHDNALVRLTHDLMSSF